MRGRPAGSRIRNQLIEILYHLKTGHGYRLYKIYCGIYGRCALKSVYYNLNKGVDTGEIEIASAVKESGDYSWGDLATKTYYKLGPKAEPKALRYVRDYLVKKKIIE